MVILLLYSVTLSHAWINNSNTLVKICRYSVVNEIGKSVSSNPRQISIHYMSVCPKSIEVNK